jgi:hypothetical protein
MTSSNIVCKRGRCLNFARERLGVRVKEIVEQAPLKFKRAFFWKLCRKSRQSHPRFASAGENAGLVPIWSDPKFARRAHPLGLMNTLFPCQGRAFGAVLISYSPREYSPIQADCSNN